MFRPADFTPPSALDAASELRLSDAAASVSPCSTEAEHFMSEML